jgi:Myb-like DNA-binding domain
LRTLDPELRRGPWSPEEDAKLRLAVEAYGNSWLDVALTIEGRNNEQCRDRWNEKLDPKINRDAWTEEEDERLLEAVSEIGEGRWKAVSETVGNGRKDSAVSHDLVSVSPSRCDNCSF